MNLKTRMLKSFKTPVVLEPLGVYNTILNGTLKSQTDTHYLTGPEIPTIN